MIPARNEAASIRRAVESAMAEGAEEVIVADGASTDETFAVAREAGAIALASPRVGRSAQMNFGASHARGDVLVFLHADSVFESGALDALRHRLGDWRIVGGCFHRTFATDSRFLRATCAIGNWRAQRLAWFLGDQALFVRKEDFKLLGGYSEGARFDDLDLSRRLRQHGPTVVVRPGVITSARRFERQKVRRATRDFLLMTRFMIRHRR